MNTLTIFLGAFGTTEIILIVVVLLLLFGGKKIPELMKGLGSGLKEFKSASKNDPEPPLTKKEDDNLDNRVI